MVYHVCRATVVCLLVPLYSLFAQSPLSRMSELIQEFNTTLEELAKSSVLQSSDSYFVNDLFLSIVRQNPSIVAVAKTDPRGIVINRVTQKGPGGVSKKVAGERWFNAVAGNFEAYIDLWSEPSGRIFQLRAWPLIDSFADSSRFVGIFSVKIDVKEFLSSITSAETCPVQISYKGETVVCSNWRDGESFGQEEMALPGGGLLTVQFQSPADSTPGQMEQMTVSRGNSDDPEIETTTVQTLIPVSEKHVVKQIPAGASLRNSSASFTALPVTSTVLNDSFLIGSNLPSLNSGRIVFITILSILTLLAIAIAIAIVFRLMFRKNDAKADASTFSPGPIDAYMIPEPSLEAPLRDTKVVLPTLEAEFLADAAAAERETRELPALRELIAESSKKLGSMDLSGDVADRDRLLREIHENLSIWVSGELRHLTNHLSSLSQSIKECENRDGHSAELQALGYEAERIIKEIQGVEQKIPNEIFS
jgi:flagellar basal body-associated protein FliL